METQFDKIKKLNLKNGVTILGVFIYINNRGQCVAKLVCRDSTGVYYPTFAEYKKLSTLKNYLTKVGVQESDMMDQYAAMSLQ